MNALTLYSYSQELSEAMRQTANEMHSIPAVANAMNNLASRVMGMSISVTTAFERDILDGRSPVALAMYARDCRENQVPGSYSPFRLHRHPATPQDKAEMAEYLRPYLESIRFHLSKGQALLEFDTSGIKHEGNTLSWCNKVANGALQENLTISLYPSSALPSALYLSLWEGYYNHINVSMVGISLVHWVEMLDPVRRNYRLIEGVPKDRVLELCTEDLAFLSTLGLHARVSLDGDDEDNSHLIFKWDKDIGLDLKYTGNNELINGFVYHTKNWRDELVSPKWDDLPYMVQNEVYGKLSGAIAEFVANHRDRLDLEAERKRLEKETEDEVGNTGN